MRLRDFLQNYGFARNCYITIALRELAMKKLLCERLLYNNGSANDCYTTITFRRLLVSASMPQRPRRLRSSTICEIFKVHNNIACDTTSQILVDICESQMFLRCTYFCRFGLRKTTTAQFKLLTQPTEIHN